MILALIVRMESAESLSQVNINKRRGAENIETKEKEEGRKLDEGKEYLDSFEAKVS